MTRKLAILGAGGHGRVVADSAAVLGWDVTFFDDAVTGNIDDWIWGGTTDDLQRSAAQFDGVIVGIGDNRTRLAWTMRLAAAGGPLTSIVDASSHVSSRAVIGSGSFLAAGSAVNIGAVLGRGCIVNTGATVDHDCQLEEGVHLSPGVHLSGTVSVGACTWLGTATSVRNNLRIGANVTAGVGSVIVNEIADGLVVAGVPARPLERS